jgi:hypothetical protein
MSLASETSGKLSPKAHSFGCIVIALKELGVLSGKRVERSERGEPGELSA